MNGKWLVKMGDGVNTHHFSGRRAKEEALEFISAEVGLKDDEPVAAPPKE